MKSVKILLIFLLVIVFSTQVFAQQGGMGITDGAGGIIVSIFDLISIQITIPNLVFAAEPVPLWVLILGFIIAFSVIHLAAGRIPLFKEAPSKGPHKLFSIAVSLMVIFSTPFLKGLLGLVGTFTSLGMIAILVLGIYMIWTLFKGGWSEQTKSLAQSGKVSAEAKEIDREAREIGDNAKAGIKALDKQKSALNRLTRGGFLKRKGPLQLDIENNHKLLEQLTEIQSDLNDAMKDEAHITGERQREIVKNLLKQLGDAISKMEGGTRRSLLRRENVERILGKVGAEDPKNAKDKFVELEKVIRKYMKDISEKKLIYGTKDDRQEILNDIKPAFDDFLIYKRDYESKVDELHKISAEDKNLITAKFNAARQIQDAINNKQVPSSAMFEALKFEIKRELSIESQYGNICNDLSSLIDKLTKQFNYIQAIMTGARKVKK